MFIMFLPVDKFGNLPYGGPCVLEVEENQVKIADMTFDNWKVIEPQEIRENWPTLSPSPYPWIEVEGPSRKLTEQEWATLIEQAVQDGKCHESYFEAAQHLADALKNRSR